MSQFAAAGKISAGSRGAAALDAARTTRLTLPMNQPDASAARPATGPEGGAFARALMRRCDRAALATSLRGAPYASLVLVAFDLDASPLLLLSDLAQHSRNIACEPRVSLLFDGTAGYPDPLSGPRLTVLGRAEASEDRRLLARFVARHPASGAYAGFADFRLYRVIAERGHLVAGFGRIEWLDRGAMTLADDCRELAVAEPEILREVDGRQAGVAARLARFGDCAGEGWRITGLDPEGVDLRREGEVARLDFVAPALSPAAAHAALRDLLGRAGRSDRAL